jgi:O-antigen/teichoic acid export membrane protein
MAGGSRAAGNAIYLGIQGLLASLFGLIQMKIFAASLGADGFSLLIVLRSLATLLTSLAMMGLPQLALRYFPQLEIRGDGGRILRFTAVLLGGLVISCLVVFLLARNFWEILAGHFSQGEVEGNFLKETLLLALAMGLTEFAYHIYQGIRRMGPMAIAEVLGLTGLTTHLFLVRGTLDPAGAINLLSIYFLIRAGMLLLLFPRFLPRGGEKREPLRITKRDFFDYWLISLPLRWVALAYFDLDRYFIGLAALEVVALFHVPSRLLSVSKRFLAAPTLSLQTEMSRYYEERREGELPTRLQLFLRAQLAVALWLGGTIFLLGRPLILLISTEEYLQALPLLTILLVTLPLTSLVASLEAAFRGLDGLRVVLVGNIIWVVVYFGNLVWVVRSCGLLGLGLIQVGAVACQVIWIMAAARRRGWLLGLGVVLPRSIVWGALPLLPALAVAWLWPGGSAFAPASGGVIAGVVVLGVSILLVIRREELLTEGEKRWFIARLPLGRFRQALWGLVSPGGGNL